MIKLGQWAQGEFYYNYLTYRVRYYFFGVKDVLIRHKLLFVFIFCLLAPGLHNISLLGSFFSGLVSEQVGFFIKILLLFANLAVIGFSTSIQKEYIRGGALRNYLKTFGLPIKTEKLLDIIISLLSINVIWVAIFIGLVSLIGKHETLFDIAQVFLYLSVITLFISYQISILHQNTKYLIITIVLFIFTVLVSTCANQYIYFVIATVSLIATAIIINFFHIIISNKR